MLNQGRLSVPVSLFARPAWLVPLALEVTETIESVHQRRRWIRDFSSSWLVMPSMGASSRVLDRSILSLSCFQPTLGRDTLPC